MGSQIKETPHVVVVGAGIIGATLAWHLTRDGAHVTILADDVGGTATPCSFAWLNASWNNPKFYYDFRIRSMAGWKRLAEQVPSLQNLIRWKGGLGWDLSPEQREAYIREHSAWGYDIRRIERAEIQALEPSLATDSDNDNDNDSSAFLPEWGIRTTQEGSVEAADAARVLLADAQAKGAVLLRSTVTDLVLRADEDGDGKKKTVTGVKTANGETITADHVVLAAGVGTTALAASAGLTVPVSGPAGLLIHTKPLLLLPPSAPGTASATETTTPHRLLNSVIYAPALHMRQTPDGRLLAGTDFAGGHPGADPAATAHALLTKVKAAFRPSAGADALELDYFTVGYRPKPEDGLPILGGVGPGVAGLSLAVMHSGVTNAAIVGELLSDLILEGKEDPALKHFALARFGKTASC